MNITSVMATPQGSYDVTDDAGNVVTVALDDKTPERAALSAWFRAGHRAGPYHPPVAVAKDRLRCQLTAQMEAMGRSLVTKYPMTEQQGWPQKIVEARGVVAGTLPVGDAFQLSIEASITGEAIADLAAATIEAAALTEMIPAITAGLRRRLEAGLDAAVSDEDIATLATSATDLRDAIMGAFATGDPEAVKAALTQA